MIVMCHCIFDELWLHSGMYFRKYILRYSEVMRHHQVCKLLLDK